MPPEHDQQETVWPEELVRGVARQLYVRFSEDHEPPWESLRRVDIDMWETEARDVLRFVRTERDAANQQLSEVRAELERNAGALDQAADELERIADGDGPARVSFNQWERDRILEQRTALRSLAEETRADSTQPQSEQGEGSPDETTTGREMVAAVYSYLCGNCGEIRPVAKWGSFIHDYDGRFGPEGELIPTPDGEESGVNRCPACGFDHEDNDTGPGVWAGTRAEMEAERAKLIEESHWADTWIETWKGLAQPDPQDQGEGKGQ